MSKEWSFVNMSRVSYDKQMRAEAKTNKEGLFTFDTVSPKGGRITMQGRCTAGEVELIRDYALKFLNNKHP